jgi:hypothetical protein
MQWSTEENYMNKEYVKFSWEGSTETKEGLCIFTVIGSPRLEVPLCSFTQAAEIFMRMESISKMAYQDGRESIKKEIEVL